MKRRNRSMDWFYRHFGHRVLNLFAAIRQAFGPMLRELFHAASHIACLIGKAEVRGNLGQRFRPTLPR